MNYLVTIEYRYTIYHEDDDITTYMNPTHTLGVCETFEEACEVGNKLLEHFEEQFPLHVFPDGRQACKERLSLGTQPYGDNYKLISNLAYLKTPFVFYLKLVKLNNQTCDESLETVMSTINKGV